MTTRAALAAAAVTLLLGTPCDLRAQPEPPADPPEPVTPAEPKPSATEDTPPAPKPAPNPSTEGDVGGNGNTGTGGDGDGKGDGEDDDDDKSSVDVVNEKAKAARSAADELEKVIATARDSADQAERDDARAKLSEQADDAATKAHAAASAANEAEIEAGLLPTSFDLLVESARAGVLTSRMATNDDVALQGASQTVKFTRAIADGAERAAKNVEKKGEADEKALAAQAERLMKYGVSFGVAAAINVPFPVRDPDLARLENPVAVAMPYLVFAPAFWTNNMSQRQYCAAEWSASVDKVEASAALALRKEKKALESTRKNQRKQLKDVEKKIAKIGTLPPAPPNGDDPRADERKRLEDLTKEKTSLESALDDTETKLSEVRGQARTYSCGWHKLGLFVGYPAMFNATTTVPERTLEDEKRRDVNPVVGFGVAGIPNAMMSILAGWTVGIVERDDHTDAILWSMVLGIGGNADLIQLFD